MKEREVNNRYRLELFSALVAYTGVLVGSIWLAKPMEDGLLRTLVLVSPVIPLLLAVWAIARHFGRMDEFMRLRSLEGLAVAAGITAALSFTYGFLEGAGFPKLSMFWVWGVMGVSWSLYTFLRCKFSR
jgi:hypothetical protein